jgi:hypothetical protein
MLDDDKAVIFMINTIMEVPCNDHGEDDDICALTPGGLVPIDTLPQNNHNNATYITLVPLVAAIGILGNLTSILILSRKPFRINILFAYLKSLAIVDFFYLAFTLVLCAIVQKQ